MRFLDSNVLLHAILLPRRALRAEEQRVKDEAKAIVKRIEDDEEDVATTVVHLSEVVNIIESGLSLEKSLGFLVWVTTSRNIRVYPVTVEDYETAVSLAKEIGVSANDALAYLCMKAREIGEIYSFDKHFNEFKDIAVLPKI